jgi:hypothetical protein
LSKSKKTEYKKPKRKQTPITPKKIFFKKHRDDTDEILFENATEASKVIGLHKEVIKRKCLKNNTEENIFRYENSEYFFDIKNGKKLKISCINNDGEIQIFESISKAAKILNANPSSIVAVCKGKRNKHRNLIFKYIYHD